MPTIGQAIRRAEQHLFVGRKRELAAFCAWLRADAPLPVILNISGPAGVGKSALLRACQQFAMDLGWETLYVDGQSFPANPEGLFAALGGASREEVLATLNERQPLVLIDTFEELESLTRYLQEEFLPHLDSEVRLVIAGRYPLAVAWSTHGTWHKLIRSLPLEGFSTEESLSYLQQRGLREPQQVERLLIATRGHPLALSLGTDMVLQLGVRDIEATPEWHLIVRSLVDRLLTDVRDPHLREALEAVALVRQFDEATLAAMLDQRDVHGAFKQLCRLSILRPVERGLTLHDSIRQILAEDLRWRWRERYDLLRRRALTHYHERARHASLGDRAWLVAERLFLLGDTFIQSMLFGPEAPGGVTVEPFQPTDFDDVMRIWHTFLYKITQRTPDPATDALTETFLQRAMRYPHARRRVVRTTDGRAIGFGVVMPICQESVKFYAPGYEADRTLRAYFTPEELAALPPTTAETRLYYIHHLAFDETQPAAARAALMRDLTHVFALEGTYLVNSAVPAYKRLLETLGYQRIPGAHSQVWGEDHATDGYVLDLARIGIDAWIESLMSGGAPRVRLEGEALERALQAVLQHWDDDAFLAGSPIAQFLAPLGASPESPDRVRARIKAALAEAQQNRNRAPALAAHALELAYLQTGASHDQASRTLAVSRATFYRLLKRGVQALARELAPG